MISIDIVFCCFFVYGLYKGYRNGFFIELASLFSFIVGVYAAIKFSSYVRDYLSQQVSWSPKLIQIAAFLLTFIGVLIAIYFLAKVITKIADFAFLGWLNRFVGAIIGLLRMFLFLSVFLSISNKISSGFIPKSIQNQSVFYRPILKASKIIFPIIEHSFEELKNKIEV